jgi:small nuclear ribonucleoprotein (snRNP)-like protein
LSAVAKRGFFQEYSKMLQTLVIVKVSSERTYTGTLLGFDPDSLSICLGEAKDEKGNTLHRIFLNGNIIEHVGAVEKPFDLQGLADRLQKVFPHLVRVHEDIGVVVVMDKIRVSEEGVIEGSGPAADRVQRVVDEFLREAKS